MPTQSWWADIGSDLPERVEAQADALDMTKSEFTKLALEEALAVEDCLDLWWDQVETWAMDWHDPDVRARFVRSAIMDAIRKELDEGLDDDG